MVSALDARRTIDAVWKLESAKIVAALARMVRDIGVAEELAQDTLVAALEQWPRTGVPDNPGAWLTTIAKRRAVDHIRRSQLLTRKQELLALELDRQPESEPGTEPDDMLRLMLISCHPVLPTEARAALTLRLLGGLTAEEIARAFLVTGRTVTQRIADAKRTLAEQQVSFDLPGEEELGRRLASVLEVIYLIFNEGYSATSGDDLMRPDLCHEALRLGRLLAVLAPREAEVHGLVALMEIHASRAAARTGPAGEPVQLHAQNRGRWDQLLIRRGFTAMLQARRLGGPAGPYVLQAAIAVCHAQAPSAEATDWKQIAALYGALVQVLPTPVVRLNRAVAVGRADGPQAGLDLTEPLTAEPALRDYHLLPSVRGDLLVGLGRIEEARSEFQRAAALTKNAAERAFLLRRAATLAAPAPAGPTLGSLSRSFLSDAGLDAATVRSYGQTLGRLGRTLGEALPAAELTADQVAEMFAATWAGAAARTWNRHRSAVRSFGAWAELPGLAEQLERRPEPRTRSSPLDPSRVDTLCTGPGPTVRDRTLWRLLHESGAGVKAVLALDVEDLDLDDRCSRTGITWGPATALLLPQLLAGRTRGPLFLTERRPGPARLPTADLCPDTGRARLSYERAEYLFKQASGGLTLRQLKPRSAPPAPAPSRPPFTARSL
ncbi:RNA polymerase sigma factor [Streptomyces sp. TRM66268-LWL]|uniref:RNA polymerase sigma factor n=1 Tax=Streptomyces polyasparticus TaxID=2767826 RepID=A0ABR7SIT6_9ACTN|nr:RNA polymerase sigma factor [Streptomyces polyasparticus]MBC9714759.1 RNA polymerase sigma factor [Streptomyces polyasparticus]